MTDAPACVDERVQRAWGVLDGVLDPEVPVLSVRDLGIVREVNARREGLEVVLTPTYSGCPATEVIERSVVDALEAAGLSGSRSLSVETLSSSRTRYSMVVVTASMKIRPNAANAIGTMSLRTGSRVP